MHTQIRLRANCADPDQTAPAPEEQSDQELHCFPFYLQIKTHSRTISFYDKYSNFSYSQSFRKFAAKIRFRTYKLSGQGP